MQIGIGGIGKMGAAIAQRLIEVGHTVTVWNRSPDKVKPLAAAGAAVAATPADLASSSEAVITVLTDAAAIDSVYMGPSGLLAPDVRGKLFIEMSTGRAQTEVALAGCRPLGLAEERVMDLHADNSGGPNVLKVRGPAGAQMLKGGDGVPVTF